MKVSVGAWRLAATLVWKLSPKIQRYRDRVVKLSWGSHGLAELPTRKALYEKLDELHRLGIVEYFQAVAGGIVVQMAQDGFADATSEYRRGGKKVNNKLLVGGSDDHASAKDS